MLSFLSCNKVIKTDLKSFLNNPEEYKGKKIILITDLEDLSKNKELYLNGSISNFVMEKRMAHLKIIRVKKIRR
jgi:predicted GTPase